MLFMLKSGIHFCLTLIVDLDAEIDRSATDLAIFDVILHFDRSVDQQGDLLPAIRALYRHLDELVDYYRERIRKMRPLSVEK